MGRGGVEVTTQGVEIDIDLSRRLGPIHRDQDAVRPRHLRHLANRQDHAVGVDDVAHRDHPRARRDGPPVDLGDLGRIGGKNGQVRPHQPHPL